MRVRAILILITATLFWGSTFPFTKELTRDLSVFFILAYRFIGTAVILFFLSFLLYLKKKYNAKESAESKFNSKLIWPVFLLGIVNFGAIYLQTIGLKIISSANAGFITALSVMFVPLLDFLFRKNPVSAIVIVSLPVSLAGIYLMSYGFSVPRGFALGDFWVFLSAVLYAVYILQVDALASKISATLLMAIVFFITALAAIGFFFFTESHLLLDSIQRMSSQRLNFLICFLIVGGTVLPYTFMVMGQKHLPAQLAALVYLLEPIFATLIAGVFFNENIFAHTVSGGILVFVALILVIVLGRQKV